jgi:hypothetical protein
VIAYGIPANYTDEYLRIGEDKTILLVRLFAKTIIHVFFKIWSTFDLPMKRTPKN